MDFDIDLLSAISDMRAGVLGSYGLEEVPDWICTHTHINGNNFSFVDHEYQQRILESTAPLLVIQKCSQVGISELAIRRVLALMDIIPGFKTIYTLPSSRFAQDFTKTRVDPIIQGSSRLGSKLNRNLDNSSIKQIGESFLYLKGTIGDASAISVPADLITVDELDFSDQNNVEKYQSRLTHSMYKWWFYLSTPTLPNFGINKQFRGTKRHYNHCKCNHCNMWFIPDYLDHVKVPDYDGDLLAVNKQSLTTLRYTEAKLLCPNCGKEPDLSPAYREWVCENPFDNFDGEGFQINPFDAPKIITPKDLLLASTRFNRKVNFVNYHLGQTMEDADSGINSQDIDNMIEIGKHGLRGFKVIGIDQGTDCHILVGVTDGYGKLLVIEKHKVRYTELEYKMELLISIHRPTTIVMDSQPYVETVHRLQQRWFNLYGAVYVTTKNLEAFRVVDKEEDKQSSLLDVRQVNVNRNVALDELMSDIRQGLIGVVEGEHTEEFREHMQDMKRQGVASRSGSPTSSEDAEPEAFAWVKTTGRDHFHHSLLYLHVAARMAHHLPSRGSLPPFVGSFSTAPNKLRR